MKKHYFLLISYLLLGFSLSFAQVGINTDQPHAEVDLELASPDKALLLNRVQSSADIANPVDGMLLFDISDDCLKVYQKNDWHCLVISDDNNADNGDNFKLPTTIPHIMINIDGGEEVVVKDNYLNANIIVDGKGELPDYFGRTQIKGRGNSTWGLPKKPYRLKLNDKASILGLGSGKNWILLAEYLDGSMLYNSIPYKTGRMLDMPYTNHIIPVKLTINGVYRGMYAFTEHKEVKENRIELDKNEGILLEMDVYYDEVWKFTSTKYNLPVMIAYPEEEDMNQQKLNNIKTAFNSFEGKIFNSDYDYENEFDVDQFVDYFLVYMLTLNEELNHPKSVYMHRKNNADKFKMGIIWDFDWSYGYETGNHYNLASATQPIFWPSPAKPQAGLGTVFFSKIFENPGVRTKFKQRWTWFRANKFLELKSHILKYATLVEQEYANDHAKWGNRDSTNNFQTDLQNVLNWLDARAAYIDNFVSTLP